MNYKILADDLTGACDTGIQLAKFGIEPIVMINGNCPSREPKTVIYNTDTRGLSPEDAYKAIWKLCENTGGEKEEDLFIYKKIDSTMRGNIGHELNAILTYYDHDFIFVVPGYPSNGRQVINKYHMLDKRLLHETDLSKDPKNPMHHSDINKMLEEQTGRKVGHIYIEELNCGYNYILEKINLFKRKGIKYVTFDTLNEHDLFIISDFIVKQPYSFVCAGSAGLINHIPKMYGQTQQELKISLGPNKQPVLFVIGSISRNGRKQLQYLLDHSDTVGIELNTVKVIQSDESKNQENHRNMKKAEEAVKMGKDIVLYSSDDLNETKKLLDDNKEDLFEISKHISCNLGTLAINIIEKFSIDRLFLSGGETAYQVMDKLKADKIYLIGQVDDGVPLGLLDSEGDKYVVTKAGNFGTEDVMVKALSKLKGL